MTRSATRRGCWIATPGSGNGSLWREAQFDAHSCVPSVLVRLEEAGVKKNLASDPFADDLYNLVDTNGDGASSADATFASQS